MVQYELSKGEIMNNFTISEAAFEFTVEKMQQTIRRLIIALIVSLILFITVVGGLIFAFLHYEGQYDTQTYEVSTDGGGDAYYSYIGKDGAIDYGESESES